MSTRWITRTTCAARPAGVTLLLHANLIDLHRTPAPAAVESATFRSPGGREVTVRAKLFALCAGGVETARFPLADRSQKPAEIGNDHGSVGRLFQDHPAARVGVLRPTDPSRFRRLFNVSQNKGLRYSGTA